MDSKSELRVSWMVSV